MRFKQVHLHFICCLHANPITNGPYLSTKHLVHQRCHERAISSPETSGAPALPSHQSETQPLHPAPTIHPKGRNTCQHAKAHLCLTPVLCAAQLVKPVEASTEVLQDVYTQEYLDQLHSSSRKVCPAQGAWISIAA